MAEILVSDFCDDRPDAGNGGPGVCIWATDGSRAATLADPILAGARRKNEKAASL